MSEQLRRAELVRELIERAANVRTRTPALQRAMQRICLDEARRKTYRLKDPLRTELRAQISEAMDALPPICSHMTGSFRCAELVNAPGDYCGKH